MRVEGGVGRGGGAGMRGVHGGGVKEGWRAWSGGGQAGDLTGRAKGPCLCCDCSRRVVSTAHDCRAKAWRSLVGPHLLVYCWAGTGSGLLLSPAAVRNYAAPPLLHAGFSGVCGAGIVLLGHSNSCLLLHAGFAGVCGAGIVLLGHCNSCLLLLLHAGFVEVCGAGIRGVSLQRLPGLDCRGWFIRGLPSGL